MKKILMPVLVVASLGCAAAMAGEYSIVVSKATAADERWAQVVDVLRAKHAQLQPQVVTFDKNVAEALPELRRQYPRYVCFVARPQETSQQFVAQIHHLTRSLNDDPYTDCFRGILTGHDADNAMRIARQDRPLVIHRVAAATEIALDMCDQGICYSEVQKNRLVRKEPGQTPDVLQGPDDTTAALAGLLNDYHADLFVTSGHASERDWMIGYTYRDGFFRCEHGELYGLDTQGHRHPIHSENPKVYLPVGNCRMGHVDGPDAMAIAYMNSAGVCQMAGYTVDTWYGYGGWGMLDYFVEQPGRYTCAEAFAAAEDALIYRLQTCFPELLDVPDGVHYRGPFKVSEAARAAGLTAQDARGLLYDRDVVAFYGDPAWQATMADEPKAYDQTLTERDGLYTFTIHPNRGPASFDPVNTNGAQRGYRPIIVFLPHRVKDVKVLEGADLSPVITENFLLVPNPRHCDPSKTYRVTFHAAASG